MNNIDEIKDELINKINELESIKRLKALEKVIDSNDSFKPKFDLLKELQKKLVNARYYKKDNTVKELEKEISLVKEDISNIVFMDEYLDLLEEAYYLIKNISNIIEYEINTLLK